jgi:glutathione S-transferase
MRLKLIIGNKNYSSWSMRPWVLMKQLDINFEEVMLKFHSREWKEQMPVWSPSGMVPVLWDGDAPNGEATWESTAIFETLHDKFPHANVWPRDPHARAMARSIVAEMHAGFRALRTNMPMNIRANHAGLGMTPEVAANIQRIETIWREARAKFGAKTDAPFLFGAFSAADAMYAPVVMRFATYAPPLAADTLAYCNAVKQAPGVARWMEAALLETEFVPEDEPYATNAKD